jgi:hypothetical protein
MDPLSAGIAGILGIGSNLVTNAGAKRRQQQADKQNVKFWEMQNAYNTPKMQMSRLKDAGLNPNLIYGNSANTGNAGAVAASKPAPYNFQDPTPTALNALAIKSQIDLNNSQAYKNNTDANAKNQQAPATLESTKQDIKIKEERFLQEAVKTKEITKQQAAITKSLQTKAEIDVMTKGYKKTEYEFKENLMKIGISPDGNVGTTILKLFAQAMKVYLEFAEKKENEDKVFGEIKVNR